MKELRYQIQMCRSQEELDKVVRRNRKAIHEHSFMRFVIENTRRNIRHIEHARAICQTYLQN
jgi:hypothetical protein